MMTKKPGLSTRRARGLATALVGAIVLAGAPMMMANASTHEPPAPVVPAGTVTLDDGPDAFTNAAEAQANKPTVTWTAAASAPVGTTTTSWFAPTSGPNPGVSPGAACGPWSGQPASSVSGSLTAACAALLPEGGFGFNVKWVSGTDESTVVTATSTMDRVVAAPAITPDATIHPLTPPGLTLNGTGAADLASITVSTPSKVAKTGTVSSPGAWSATYTSSFTEGKHSFTATATDLAGNVSAASAPQIIRFSASAVAPAAPVVTSPATNADIPASVGFTGTAPAGTVVILTTPIGSPPVDTELGRATAAPNGSWAIGVSGLAAGQRAFTFTATDNVDRVSADVVRNHFVDNVKPVIAITQQNSSFYSSGQAVVKGNAVDNRAVISRVVVQLKNAVTGQLAAPMDATFNVVNVAAVGDPEDVGYVPAYSYWTWSLTFTPPVGAWSGQVFAVDAAGNVSNAANMTTFVSAVPPAGP
ncbi:MAG: Ig-like domain-containing protein [Microthrixaceae bacterium]